MTLSEQIAERISDVVASIPATMVAIVLVTIPFYAPSVKDAIFYFSSSWLQLVLLPILAMSAAVGAKRVMDELKRIEKQHKQDHELMLRLLKELGVNGK
jgi:hypothetical protein